MTFDFRQRLLATTLLVGAGMLATPAIGQTVPPTGGTPTDTSNPSGPVEAQPVPATAATGAPVTTGDEIIVTGTRIPQPNLTSSAPITTVTSQDIKLSGTTKVEDLLNSLPQVYAGQTSTLSNGASGTATVNLRGLGSTRTLVLINGRRLMPGDPNSSAADLNFIPSALVKRIEVLTGGASATYGADAVAGVVNFIMDKDFTGIRFDGNYGVYQHNNRNKILPPLLDARARTITGYSYPKGSVVDGAAFDGTLSFGTNFDDNRGHITGYVGYRKANPLLQRRRDYSACTVQETGASLGVRGSLTNPRRLNPNAPLQCGGSATSPGGNALFFVASTTSSTIGALGPGTLTQGTLTRFNFAPLNHFQRPDERYTAGVFADYEVTPAIKPYMEFMFMDDRTLAQIAPSGDFGNTNTINCDNPLMSASQRAQICAPANLINGFIGTFPTASNAGYNPTPGAPAIDFFDPRTGTTYNKAFFQLLRRNVEGGPRINDLQHTSFRGLVGSRGDLGSAWTYDGYYQYGRTNYTQVYKNEFSATRLRNALDVVSGPGGAPVCRSVTDNSDPNCVPYDVFGGTPSAASIAYLNATGFQKGTVSEQVADISFTGDLGKYGLQSPFASTGIGVNIGAEYRKESLDLQTDNAFQTGDLTGQGAPTLPVSGSYNVKELFGEVSIPLVNDNFIYDLSVNGGYRYSSYKVSNGRKFNTNTYKLGVEFAPVKDIRFRASYNRAVRTPNIQELFSPQIVGLDGSTDPCAGRAITASAADAGCRAQGLRVGQTVTPNPAAQYNGFVGGNGSLNPEKATTKTFGVVLQPRFLPRFALTADYFDIKVANAIQGFGADAILAACTNAPSNPVACALIHRDVAGSLWLSSQGFVTDIQQNVGGVQTKGYEFNGSYSQRLGGIGSLSASFIGTYLKNFKVDNGLTQVYDCAGYYGPTCGGPSPKWRHKARLSLTMPNGIALSGQWRYAGKVDVEYKNPSTTLSGPFYNFGSTIKSQSYFDLAANVTIGNHYNWRIGVNNLLDRQPPLVTSGSGAFGASACAGVVCNGNTYPGSYDALGRFLYTGITLNF